MKKTYFWQFLLPILAAGMLGMSLTAFFLQNYYEERQLCLAGGILKGASQKDPETLPVFLEALKEYTDQGLWQDGGEELAAFGYEPSQLGGGSRELLGFSLTGALLGLGLVLGTVWLQRQAEKKRIKDLTDYLERVRSGKPGTLWDGREDDCSVLRDTVYKTVTELYQTREEAVEARNRFAENLSNIAHQLKTPVTSVSLLAQLMEEEGIPKYPDQIRKQLGRLWHLEDALLVLARIDAGALVVSRKQTDAFTVLTLAADNLQELADQAKVSLEVPELGEAELYVDLDWTMEAVMNLMKNSVEHTPEGGKVRCVYEENPLYVEIRILDGGPGFCTEDLPHLFERFYRGRNASAEGVGIGLSLAKELLHMQDGLVSAYNLPEGGACFEIRLYRH